MSLSYAAHINGDKVYDIATGYWIKAKKEAAATSGRMQIAVYLYSPTGDVVDKFVGVSFPEADIDKYNFVGIEIVPYSATAVTYYLWTESISQYSRSISYAQQNSATLKQYFSGEQGYAINADYAVIDVQPYSITENGVYTAPFSKAYSPVTVDVQEQPWQPLQDGYSNFWVWLDNDTLSPQMNFSSVGQDATIDWGDGSGEVALDTLTPTHTYARAGKYIIKVGGTVTFAANCIADSITTSQVICYAVEISSGVTMSPGTFQFQGSLRYADISGYTQNAHQSLFDYDAALYYCKLPNTSTIGRYVLRYCRNIPKITIPANVTSIGNSAFNTCTNLSEIHIQATEPPTLGDDVFRNIAADYVMYVPVGYGDTYKAAAGWSTYADHILEEGQTPNRAMLSRLAKAADTDTDEDKR